MPRKTSKGFSFKPFSRKQRQLMYWWAEGSSYRDLDMVIADGAIRSGKTVAMICGFFLWSLSMFEGETFILAGKTIGALKKNVIGPALQILRGWGLPYTYVSSGDEARLEVGTNTYYLYDAHNERSQDRLQGLTAAGALADEVALFPQNFIEQMIGRCSVDGAKLWLNCNPENPKHYVKTELIDKQEEKGIYHLHFLMSDNLSLSPKVRERYERMFSGVFYDRFIRGIWALADGLIYQYFASYTDEFLIDDPLQWCRDHHKRINRVMLGVDFGGTNSHTAFKAVGITYDWTVLVLDEEHIDSRELDPDKLNRRFAEFVLRVQSTYGRSQTRADNEESVLIRGLQTTVKREHLDTTVLNAKKMPINDRIKLTILLMAQKRLYVARRCKHMIDAFQTAVYDSKSFEDVRLDDGTSDIDSLDAFEYCIEIWREHLVKGVRDA